MSFLFVPVYCLAQVPEVLGNDSAILSELTELVLNSSKETVEPDSLSGANLGGELEIPSEITDVVAEFYAETVVSDAVSSDILQYLISMFSEHDFRDTGGWVNHAVNQSYVPYPGELPDYDLSSFRLPAHGHISSSYGFRPAFGRFHHGIDVSLNPCDTVKAALPGVVVKSGFQPNGYGRYIIVSHAGDIQTLYAHLSATLVHPGQTLDSGTPLGLAGSSGNSTGTHLHFETRFLGVPVNPFSWFELSQWTSP